jgi:hypothetical protein
MLYCNNTGLYLLYNNLFIINFVSYEIIIGIIIKILLRRICFFFQTAVEWVLSTSETVGVNVFPPHLRETSLDMWLHSSTKDITDPISNTIVSSGGTTASFVDGHISSFVDDLKQVDFDNLLAEHHDRYELFEERSLTSEKPASSSSSKSFEVLKWVANQEQNSNEHLLKRLNSLDIDIDVHSIGRTMNKVR